MKKFLILVLLTFFFLPSLLYAQADPSPVTPSSVTGRVLPLPLKQSSRRIKIGWEISPSANVTHYCIYYRKTDSPPTSGGLDEQPCYDLSDSAVSVVDTDSVSYDVVPGEGPNGRDVWEVTISDLDYKQWYIFQITANENSASCSGCIYASIDGDSFSYPSPFESYGIYIQKSALKWEEYTEE